MAWSLASKASRIQPRSSIPWLRRVGVTVIEGASTLRPRSDRVPPVTLRSAATSRASRLVLLFGCRHVGVANQLHDPIEALVESVLQPRQIGGGSRSAARVSKAKPFTVAPCENLPKPGCGVTNL